MTHLLCLGARPETLAAAHRLGVSVIDVQRPGPALRPRTAPPDLVVDFTDDAALDSAVDELRGRLDLTGVVSLTEAGLVAAARQRARLGLAGHGPEVSRRLRDKAAMRTALEGVPDLVPVPWAVVTDDDDAIAEARRIGYPLVLKPVDGAASVGVFAVHDEADLHAALDRLRALQADPDRPGRDDFTVSGLLLESFVEGPEFSVECFSFAGRHVVVTVTEKAVGPHFVEHGHVVPARCLPAHREALSRAAVQTLTAVGVTDGPSHTEVKLTPHGPAVVESHDRPGGDRIVDLVVLATGVDLEEAALAWAAGAMEPLPGPPAVRQAAATRFVSGAPGRVVRLEGLEAAAAVPGVVDARFLLAEGDVVRHGNGNLDRVAQVVSVGPSAARARRSAETAAAVLRCEVAPLQPAAPDDRAGT